MFESLFHRAYNRSVAIGAFALVGTIVVAELLARILGFGHPIIYQASLAGFEPRPEQTVTILGHTSHYNAVGMRGHEITAVPLFGVTRILSLGDSVTNGGTQINDDQMYGPELEANLNAEGKKVQVVTTGVPGWSVINEQNWLQEHGLFGSKIVLLEVNEKDLGQPFADSNVLDENPSFPTRYPITAIGNIIGRYINPKLGLSDSSDPGSTTRGEDVKNAPAVLAAVDGINAFVISHGAKLIVFYWDGHYVPQAPETASERNALFAWAGAHNVQVIRPNFGSRSDWKLLYRDHMHPNAAANVLIAKQLTEAF